MAYLYYHGLRERNQHSYLPGMQGKHQNGYRVLHGYGKYQNHLSYTGKSFDLVSQTGESENRTAAWVGAVSNTQTNAGKLNCT